jgi:hypothetical protein
MLRYSSFWQAGWLDVFLLAQVYRLYLLVSCHYRYVGKFKIINHHHLDTDSLSLKQASIIVKLHWLSILRMDLDGQNPVPDTWCLCALHPVMISKKHIYISC